MSRVAFHMDSEKHVVSSSPLKLPGHHYVQLAHHHCSSDSDRLTSCVRVLSYDRDNFDVVRQIRDL